MVRGENAIIRSAGPDDTSWVMRIFDPRHPRAALLDQKREFTPPTAEEVREMLTGATDKQISGFLAVEDLRGEVRGFCALRPSAPEQFIGLFILIFFEDEDYSRPIGGEVCDYLLEDAWQRKRLKKVMAHCLDRETALRAFLARKNFESDGIQREVLYTGGRWHDIESLTLFAPNAGRPTERGATTSAVASG